MSGITNPSTSTMTSSFSVYTMDSSYNIIENVSSGMGVKLITISNLTYFNPSFIESNIINGALGNILIAVTTTSILSNGSVLYFTLPS